MSYLPPLLTSNQYRNFNNTSFYPGSLATMLQISQLANDIAAVSAAVVGLGGSSINANIITESTANFGTTINGVKTITGGYLQVAEGSNSSPSIYGTNSVGTGLYFSGQAIITIASGGTDAFIFDGTLGSEHNESMSLLLAPQINLNADPNMDAEGSLSYDAALEKGFKMRTNAGFLTLVQDLGWTFPTGTGTKAGFDADSLEFTGQIQLLAQTVKAMLDHLGTKMGIFIP